MIWGTFSFNIAPMGPLGCKIIVHENTGNRGSRSVHALPVFYIGPFMNGYRMYKVYIPFSRERKSTETVKEFPQSTKMLIMSTTEAIKKAVANISLFWKILNRQRQ